jgi:hypothetical protein
MHRKNVRSTIKRCFHSQASTRGRRSYGWLAYPQYFFLFSSSSSNNELMFICAKKKDLIKNNNLQFSIILTDEASVFESFFQIFGTVVIFFSKILAIPQSN